MIFPVALYYLVVLPVFHVGEGDETAPLAFVVAFLAVFLASAWFECHVIGNLPFAWFVVKLALVVGAAAALFFSMATMAQLGDAALAVFALESVSALVTAFSHVLVEYQQVFVVAEDEPFTTTAETATFTPSPPVVVSVVVSVVVPVVAAVTTSSPPSPPPPQQPFDVERYLRRAHIQYQLEVEAAEQRIRRLLEGIYVERVYSHATPVSPPVTTAPPAVTDQPQATTAATTTETPAPPPPSSSPTTSSPAAVTDTHCPYDFICVRTHTSGSQEMQQIAQVVKRRHERREQRLAAQTNMQLPVHDDAATQLSPSPSSPRATTAAYRPYQRFCVRTIMASYQEMEREAIAAECRRQRHAQHSPIIATSETSSPVTTPQSPVPHVEPPSLPQLASDNADRDAAMQLPTHLDEPSVESQSPPSPTLSSTRPARRNVRRVKSTKRERTDPTPPATYTTRSGRAVRPPDRFMFSPPGSVDAYTTRSGRRVQPPSRFTVEVFGTNRY